MRRKNDILSSLSSPHRVAPDFIKLNFVAWLDTPTLSRQLSVSRWYFNSAASQHPVAVRRGTDHRQGQKWLGISVL